jgi:pyruvate,water dikinase
VAECTVRVVKTLAQARAADVDKGVVLVVQFADAGWAPVLVRAGALIAEVGGQLSHGAIVAREYGLPAVMNLERATSILRDGQRVRIDGTRGTVEVLS